MLELAKKPDDGAVICTITADAGIGKTSFAATFPNPLFIRVEDGMQSIPRDKRPDALPVIESVDDLWAQLKAVITEEHNYKTIVIDSVTKLERMFEQHVVDSDDKKPKSINQAMGGYGAGLAAVGALHGRVRKAAGALQRKGINVVFIAHADTTTVNLPDEEPYMRYDLRLGKKSVAAYVDDVDLVGFIKLETFTRGEDGERKKAISDGTRMLVCHATASSVSKNRFGITEPIQLPLGENPLAGIIPALKTTPAKGAK